ncbi:IS1167 transposase [Streptococcus pneumoniae]|nr:IS1167 transposase [Streptococcus pneumoniae]
MDIMEPILCRKKAHMTYNEKRQKIIRKIHMEQLHFITKLLDIKDKNIQIIDVVNRDSHKEIIAKLDYDAPSCPECGNQLKKYDFQKPSKIPLS